MLRWALRFALGLLALAGYQIAIILTGNLVEVAHAAPALTLDPDHGPCATLNPPITVYASGLPAGLAVDVVARRATAPPNQPVLVIGRGTVNADGTLVIHGPLGGCAPQVPDGTQFLVEVEDLTPPPDGGHLTILASATFTKEAAAPTMPGLPNTGGGSMVRGRVVFDPAVFGGVLGLLGTLLVGSFRWRRSRC